MWYKHWFLVMVGNWLHFLILITWMQWEFWHNFHYPSIFHWFAIQCAINSVRNSMSHGGNSLSFKASFTGETIFYLFIYIYWTFGFVDSSKTMLGVGFEIWGMLVKHLVDNIHVWALHTVSSIIYAYPRVSKRIQTFFFLEFIG